MSLVASHMFSAYELGATLYMPVIHPKVPDILSGCAPAPASSIVLCLEDALHEADVERGVKTLTTLLSDRASGLLARPRVFIRPRSYDMACRLRAIRGIDRIDGFVIPKARPETIPDWASLLNGTRLRLMPTLETPDLFEPARLTLTRDVLIGAGPDRIAAVRLGGNDLLGAMALRRVRGVTAYEGPLAWFLSMAAGVLTSSGLPVAAPVFDIIEDLETLRREVERDVQMGFVSKTAIHPVQVSVIESALAVSEEEIVAAAAILEHDDRAVFQIGGVMCEPATHAGWARRVRARADRFGATGRPARSVCA
jgi:citrate lyase beta subunit